MIPAATAAIGAMSAKNRNDNIESANKANAEITRYSPWTGMQGQIQAKGPSMMEGAFAGGLQGLGMAQGMGFGGGAPSAGAPAGGMMAGGGSPLGGQDMSAQLGMQGNMFEQSMNQQPNFFAKR